MMNFFLRRIVLRSGGKVNCDSPSSSSGEAELLTLELKVELLSERLFRFLLRSLLGPGRLVFLLFSGGSVGVYEVGYQHTYVS